MTLCTCNDVESSTSATALLVNNSGTGANSGKALVASSSGDAEAILATSVSSSHYCGYFINFNSAASALCGDAKGSGTGVAGYSASGTAVYGSAGGSGTGVWGSGTTGYGTKGVATSGFGIYGIATTGYGSYGYSTSGIGMYSSAGGVSGSVGIYSSNSNGYPAGYFSGNVSVIGTLSKSAGTFTIDHPLDPKNKVLQHSFVESPDMKNIYDGIVILDDSGNADVKLPDYFEALNKDFRYQLTSIGSPNIPFVSKEVKDNSFSIKGEANQKISWLITGVRQDAFAVANPVIVEYDKPESEKGFYLNPEVFGKTHEDSIGYMRHGKIAVDEKVE